MESSPTELINIATRAKERAMSFFVVRISVGSMIKKMATGITKLSFDAIEETATPNSAVHLAIKLNKNKNPKPMAIVKKNHGMLLAVFIIGSPPESVHPNVEATP